MSLFAVFALTIGAADLARGTTSRGARYAMPLAVGIVTALLVAGLAALNSMADVVILLVVLAALAGWVVVADHALRQPTSRGRAGAALAVLAAGAAVVVGFSGAASPVGGPLADWLRWTAIPRLPGFTPDRVVLLAGLFIVQFATGNLLVRLTLCLGGAPGPAGSHSPASRLKGGRLIGPMERVFILGLGLAGQLTAASVVVAAKGLIRWPELQAVRESDAGTGIDAVTEYFLVGSFVSWLVALASLALVRVS